MTALRTPVGKGALTGRRKDSVVRFAPLAGIVVVLILAAITTPDMFQMDALRLVAFQIGIVGITAIGQTLVLLTGGIDLSVGAVIGLTTVIIAQESGARGTSLAAGLLLAIAAGVVVGGVNAALVLLRGVPPFVATFATFVLVQGSITAWTGGAPSGSIPPALTTLGVGQPLGVPTATWIFLGAALLVAGLLSRTTIGRRLYAAGFNRRAAELSGIRTLPLFSAAYVVSALLAVLAGLIYGGYVGHVDAQLSHSLNLDSIAAAVIGGVALTGGRGNIGNTLVGVVLLALLLVWMVQLGAGAGGQLVIEGLVILFAAWLQSGRTTTPPV
jgi:ribose/xylose/arabinose/galactoside ABC-type transport system permease subunit